MEDLRLLRIAFSDLQADLEELNYLLQDNLQKLSQFTKDLKRTVKHFPDDLKLFIERQTQILQAEYQKYLEKNQQFLQKSTDSSPSLSLINELTQYKNGCYQFIRTSQGILSSLVTASDWQSPSYDYSLVSQAGRQTGQIIGTINDYKRDQHLDGRSFEARYLSQYIDTNLKLLLKVYATNSGMAAFATILGYLLGEKKIKGKVLVGKSVYFENRELLRKSLGKQIIDFDETKTAKIISLFKKHQPSVMILDTLTNTAGILVPNLEEIFDFLKREWRKEIYVVVDNTCLSSFFQPIKLLAGLHRKITVMSFESLNKYLQFGLDRVTGGIIAAIGKDVGKLYTYRDRMGTNLLDSSVYAIPTPNRFLLEKRLLRHQRNTLYLAQGLQDYLDQHPDNRIEQIVYPGLANHPCYPWTQKMKFRGSFFNFKFRKKSFPLYKKFIKNVLSEAKKSQVNLIAGTSFGLNTTRIYLTSLRADSGEPFVRTAVGTEHLLEIEKIKGVFIKALQKFCL